MKLHLLGLPHTVTNDSFSHCAYTGKILRFAPMLRAQGFEVIHYGVAGAQSGADEQVDIMTTDEHLRFLNIKKYHDDATAFVGDKAVIGTPLFTQFNFRLRDELVDRLEPGDVVCLPMGHAHENAVTGQPLIKSGEVVAVETGIGYPNPCTIRRIYESQCAQGHCVGWHRRCAARGPSVPHAAHGVGDPELLSARRLARATRGRADAHGQVHGRLPRPAE